MVINKQSLLLLLCLNTVLPPLVAKGENWECGQAKLRSHPCKVNMFPTSVIIFNFASFMSASVHFLSTSSFSFTAYSRSYKEFQNQYTKLKTDAPYMYFPKYHCRSICHVCTFLHPKKKIPSNSRNSSF